jgi:hypothetical protein
MSFSIGWIVKLGPALSAVVVAAIFWFAQWKRGRACNLDDIFIVGLAGGAFPSGALFIYAALVDATMLSKLAETPIYIALAGFAILYISGKTVRERFI